MTFYIVTQSTWIATFAYIVYRQVKHTIKMKRGFRILVSFT